MTNEEYAAEWAKIADEYRSGARKVNPRFSKRALIRAAQGQVVLYAELAENERKQQEAD